MCDCLSISELLVYLVYVVQTLKINSFTLATLILYFEVYYDNQWMISKRNAILPCMAQLQGICVACLALIDDSEAR